MKKVKILIGILIAIVLITSFLICYILRHPLFSYEKNYFEKIGIKNGFRYEDIRPPAKLKKYAILMK